MKSERLSFLFFIYVWLCLLFALLALANYGSWVGVLYIVISFGYLWLSYVVYKGAAP